MKNCDFVPLISVLSLWDSATQNGNHPRTVWELMVYLWVVACSCFSEFSAGSPLGHTEGYIWSIAVGAGYGFQDSCLSQHVYSNESMPCQGWGRRYACYMSVSPYLEFFPRCSVHAVLCCAIQRNFNLPHLAEEYYSLLLSFDSLVSEIAYRPMVTYHVCGP